MKLKDLGIHFDKFGCLCDPVPGLLVSLGIYVELVQESLYVSLILYDHESVFKTPGEI